ncbi:MAG: sulfurtransferase-like selenium metabolism protein YedF [Clostridiales bacterium]|nr:sulfurtransferase-like selenium metabolism protein YedF [Clostridiales bacterium]
MTTETLDCRGLSCPMPVVEAKKKLTQMQGGMLNILVDNETAKNNLLKLAGSLNLEVVSREDKGVFAVTVLLDGNKEMNKAEKGKVTFLITADTMGRGDEELGKLLIKSFFYALAESDKLPESVSLVNSAVTLACDGSPSLESLEKLASRGVAVYSCGLCLDFYHLKEKLRVGEVTNMYSIVDQLTSGQAMIL